MLLRTLTLNNFGTYAGRQTLDLSTTTAHNIILVGGKNGAGKSTILEAIRLCVHGQLTNKLLNTRDKYERYLRDRIHRGSASALPAKSASVEIEFDYADQEETKRYRAARVWERTSTASVQERFELSCDGVPVTEVDQLHWEDFVQELIPIGVSDLFFFDGEKVQLLAEDESDKRTLSEAVKSLLGVDLIEKLSADIGIYRSRALQPTAGSEVLPELGVLQTTVEVLRGRVEDALRDAADEDLLVATQTEFVAAAEQELQSKGGKYAKGRARLDERKKQLAARIALLEDQIRQAAQGLLGVAVAPKLLRGLLDQLVAERQSRESAAVSDALKKASQSTLARFRKLEVKRNGRQVAFSSLIDIDEIAAILQKSHKPIADATPLIHDLSREQDRQLNAWAVDALEHLPRDLHRIREELETLYRELQTVERDLARIPAEDVLQPMIQKLNEAHKLLGEAGTRAALKQTVLAQLRESLDRAERTYEKAVDAVASRSSIRIALEKASRVQDVLSEFKKSLIEQKLKQVQAEATICFNLLSRKDLKRQMTIDPNTFAVTIKSDDGSRVDKGDFSAGEKQIYAISMLWALARVSGRPLPLIIDTPLARLDKDHRKLLGTHYFPHASHQVIILSTDTEIDETILPLMGSHVSKSYELDFDSASRSTTVRQGYFVERAKNEIK
jgi:DNA sulfur modification protein DndD